MKRYDVLIIGGGVVGCAAARELARYKLDIALLEAGEDICSGQSKANTAIVHGGYDAKPGTLKAKFNVLGSRMFPDVCRELDVPYENNGSLVVAFSKEGIPGLETLKKQGEENGVPGLEILDEAALRAKEPNVGSQAVAALWVPTGGICCPYELTAAYAENAAKNGVEFFREHKVVALEKTEDGYRAVTEKGKEFSAKAVVNCAGVHSHEINNMVSGEKYGMTPRRGQYYLLDKSYRGAFKSAMFQLPTKMGKGVLVAPTVDGTILVGPTAEDIDDPDDTRTTAEGLSQVMERALLTWENIPKRGVITTFSGIRAHCSKGDFVIGEAPDAPFFFNALGIESPGLSSAPAIAVHLADEVSKRLGAERKSDFDPIRKGFKKFRDMTDEERAEAIKEDGDYAKIVCRCESVTEAEIRRSIRNPVGARSVDGVKRRTRAGMGRCQSGFCLTRTMEILSEELGIPMEEVTKFGGNSYIVEGRIFPEAGE